MAAFGVEVRVDRGRQALGVGGADGGELAAGQPGAHHLVRVSSSVTVAQGELLAGGPDGAAGAEADRLGATGLPGGLPLAISAEEEVRVRASAACAGVDRGLEYGPACVPGLSGCHPVHARLPF